MKKGYQVIEIPRLNTILDDQTSYLMVISVLYFIGNELDRFFEGQLKFEVLRIQYLGDYPSLGAQYLVETDEDFEEVIIDKSEAILSQFSIEDLIQFCEKNWPKIKKRHSTFL